MDEEKKGLILSLLNLIEGFSSTIEKLSDVLSGQIKDDDKIQSIIEEAIDKLDKKE